ncbi:hypothetical protein FRC02_005544 [Tulasnella sp. 418]|nr:hypothetical protein FRC02_005544 [Tulasnella sp. 418]
MFNQRCFCYFRLSQADPLLLFSTTTDKDLPSDTVICILDDASSTSTNVITPPELPSCHDKIQGKGTQLCHESSTFSHPVEELPLFDVHLQARTSSLESSFPGFIYK